MRSPLALLARTLPRACDDGHQPRAVGSRPAGCRPDGQDFPAMAVELVWEAPGEGDWWLVREHFPNTVSRMFSSLFPAVTLGWEKGGARYGLPTGQAQWASVNGWIYYGTEIPLTADDLAGRERAAAATLAAAPWRDEVRRWHDEGRPRAVDANRRLQSDGPENLDDTRLGEHFEETLANFLRWAPLHFEHVGFDIVAGLFLGAAADWGVEPAALTGLLAGASPASSAADAHVRAIADALDRAASPVPVASIADLRAVSGAAAPLDAYLEDYGWRLMVGQDLVEPTLREQPALLVATVNARRGGRDEAPRDLSPGIRAALAPTKQARFDALLGDARASYALRDDDNGVCWNWPLGLVRRAGLEIGRRLAARGVVADPRHVFEAGADEAPTLLSGPRPSAAELARRWRERARASAEEPPQHLDGGGERLARPSLPPAVARLSAVRDAVWSVAPPRAGAPPLSGIGIGHDKVVGAARVVRRPEDLARLVEGDVLVAVATTAAFNTVLPLVSAVVTEQGGVFSHAAVLCRELGLPAVVGVAELLDRIGDGDLVEVDPLAGTVRLLAYGG
ncbi:MAG: hypothetical protein GEV08_00370 [Acidimicrobiia bacterium]|nr:hypothetical protein [Acidimicrobiia bacterium]